jgi:hypothetical protein
MLSSRFLIHFTYLTSLVEQEAGTETHPDRICCVESLWEVHPGAYYVQRVGCAFYGIDPVTRMAILKKIGPSIVVSVQVSFDLVHPKTPTDEIDIYIQPISHSISKLVSMCNTIAMKAGVSMLKDQ